MKDRHWSRRLVWSLGALVVVLVLLWAILPSLPRRKAAQDGAPVVVRARASVPRQLGNFGEVVGSHSLMADIFSGDEYSSSGSILSGGGVPRIIHNYVFLNLNDLSSHRLLPTNDAYIRSHERITTAGHLLPEYDGNSGPSPAIGWFLYHVVTTDTNHNGTLDGDDLFTLAVSDPDGRHYRELISGIHTIHGKAMRNDHELVVIHDAGGKPQVNAIDLTSGLVTPGRPLTDLGPDVR